MGIDDAISERILKSFVQNDTYGSSSGIQYGTIKLKNEIAKEFLNLIGQTADERLSTSLVERTEDQQGRLLREETRKQKRRTPDFEERFHATRSSVDRKRHKDHELSIDSEDRTQTVVLYLTGGGTLTLNDTVDIEAKPGRLVIFDGDIYHNFKHDETTAHQDGNRYMVGPLCTTIMMDEGRRGLLNVRGKRGNIVQDDPSYYDELF